MRRASSGKVRIARRQTVAVVSSVAELDGASRLRALPDLFELRLDGLLPVVGELETHVPRLRRPVILTARHPAEGGRNDLTAAKRRALLLGSLRHAAYIDVELRSARSLGRVLREAAIMGVRRILSVHHFDRTPSLREIERSGARALAASADVIKLVTRVETPAELNRLIAGFELLQQMLPTSAMGVGALGRQSRIELFQRGAVLNYAYLGEAQTDGQLALPELLRLARSH